jgi:hypothetical protein
LKIMNPMIVKSKVNENKVRQSEERTYEQVKEAYKWVKGLFDREYLEVLKIYKLQSPEAWAMYEHMDAEGFREVKLLNEKLGVLRKSINSSKRPSYFKKKGAKKHGNESNRTA